MATSSDSTMSTSTNVSTSANILATPNSSNPLYLHHSNQLGITLVSQPLIGDNYATSSRAMIVALNAKNKLYFVDGSYLQPSTTAPNFASWTRCNHMVLSWILNALTKELSNSVVYTDSAYAVWIDLHDHFSQSNGPHIFQLQRSICSYTQAQSTIATYFSQLKSYWDELSSPVLLDLATRRMIGLDKEQNGLYHFIPHVPPAVLSANYHSSSKLWH
ncbi:uncharacterized protein LOC131226935 [Magnolia sinica]|uniref:uncharacterized protein LOC131226935 n=1 Tax=Magnolia sinica TaxID=86752 RepID=UPI00265A2E4C|nr:uncharacterized protein LOC131226935 [Magnolia sinica]